MSELGALALFLGNDATSHFVANALARDVRLSGRNLLIIRTHQRTKPEQPQLGNLYNLERALVPKLYSVAKSMSDRDSTTLSEIGREFAGKRRREVATVSVEDVNSEDTRALLEKHHVRVGVCVRCYQKFSAEFLSYFSDDTSRSKMYNLHPGLLPQYRGVLTFARSMLAREDSAGFTLHEMTERWDSGGVVSQCSRSIDYRRSVLENMLVQYHTAAELVAEQIQYPDRAAPSVRQQEEASAYFSHLDQSDIDQLADQGTVLVDPEGYLRLLATILGASESGRQFVYDELLQHSTALSAAS